VAGVFEDGGGVSAEMRKDSTQGDAENTEKKWKAEKRAD
jgi:hypothetical protein